MLKTRISGAIAAFAAASSFLTCGALLAQSPKLVAGTLACKGKGGTSFVFGSNEQFRCTYTTAAGHRQYYRGSISKLGLDVGYKGSNVLLWTVLGGTTDYPPGALAGSYAGVSANAAVGLGGGVNALVGGSNDSIVLQPFSVQGQQGFNIAAAVSELRLITVR